MSICLRVPKGAQTFPRYHPAWTSSSIGQVPFRPYLFGTLCFRGRSAKTRCPCPAKRVPSDRHSCPPGILPAFSRYRIHPRARGVISQAHTGGQSRDISLRTRHYEYFHAQHRVVGPHLCRPLHGLRLAAADLFYSHLLFRSALQSGQRADFPGDHTGAGASRPHKRRPYHHRLRAQGQFHDFPPSGKEGGHQGTARGGRFPVHASHDLYLALHSACHPVVLPHASGPGWHGRRWPHIQFRALQGKAAQAGGRPAQGDLCRRGRCGRGQGRAQGSGRVPLQSKEVHTPWRPHSQGRAPCRPSRNRQDPACPRSGWRGWRSLLLHFRLRLCGDVRGRWRVPRARPL